MNNWEKSNLELTPAPEMTMLEEGGTVTVLIKHDYYSSDSDHGRILLGSFLDSLAERGSDLAKVILIDSAVNLLNDVSFAQKIEKLFSLSKCSKLSHPYMTTGTTIALTRRTLVGKVISLLFNLHQNN